MFTAIAVAAYVASAALIILGIVNIRAGVSLRTQANIEASNALREAQLVRDLASRQLAAAERLADQFRQQREWIETNPEQFRANLRAHLNGAAQ